MADQPADAPSLFPAIEPFDHAMLDVGDGHRVYYEQCGSPRGIPVVFLHGGPGSGCSPRHRRLIDPQRFRIVLFDQRGCGRSTPHGMLAANTTDHLVADIERLRAHLGIRQWLAFGGSWGSSLALVYCARHPDACLGAILRGIFLTGDADLDWFLQGAAALCPDAWEKFSELALREPSGTFRQWLFDCVRDAPEAQALEAVRHWMHWEDTLSSPGRRPPASVPALPQGSAEAVRMLSKYRLQAHYLRNGCFIGEDRAIDCAARMAGIPTAIIHGRLDFVCRPANAWTLHKAIPGSRLHLVDGAGHSPFDPPLTQALVSAAHHFAAHGDFAAWGEGHTV